MSDLLYHVKRTITNFADDKSGATRVVDVLGTFTDLAAAKLAANAGLASEGYVKDDFEVYEQKSETAFQKWKHADEVTVFARAPAGQEFEVCLDTKPNTGFEGNVNGEVEGHLHYVLQTTIDYNNDRIGGIQTTEVEGTYPTRAQAFEAAKTILLDNEVKKSDFAEYDAKDEFEGEWPYGDECLVHAVGQTGENFKVLVKAQPHSHKLHACKHHEGKKCECECQHGDAACKAKQCKHDDCECSSKSR
ncbi:uncharacterized protein L3040_007942 [Drepanopeziza brunnea f. sp. 'multigermtubi']|uniref:Uncharacterized protein n=1 Tax=Marssonina brunnea f. sp. multigermtubi (strain MB_m1) TaxID=1072389 RepID=K1W9X2_MARBU|nr:uncharacterized protein MBM_07732 [Drepanopeziza brunnea f. sp. 'multigermtubi' MB_m1]EKD14055.1 hypothetical protein MBM_07732 [Drepanopeziza brunnea f. sp. 'multigermtubi' MB_m1]KAJ5035475.1 hypothetical protein L3040_007942 [Drepanopeziza brunnea f. sp. 'multigermtubi']